MSGEIAAYPVQGLGRIELQPGEQIIMFEIRTRRETMPFIIGLEDMSLFIAGLQG